MYLFNTNLPEYHGRLTAFAQCCQILTPVAIPILAYLNAEVFEGDWDKQILLYSVTDIGTFCVLLVFTYLTYRRFL